MVDPPRCPSWQSDVSSTVNELHRFLAERRFVAFVVVVVAAALDQNTGHDDCCRSGTGAVVAAATSVVAASDESVHLGFAAPAAAVPDWDEDRQGKCFLSTKQKIPPGNISGIDKDRCYLDSTDGTTVDCAGQDPLSLLLRLRRPPSSSTFHSDSVTLEVKTEESY